MGEDVQKSRLSCTTNFGVSIIATRTINNGVCRDLRRSHESEQLARLYDTINIAENGLGLLGLAVLDGDGDTLPPEAPDVGVGQLSVVATNHLLDVGHLAATPAVLVRNESRRGEAQRTRSLAEWGR
jgi:hypothetical protein